MEELPRKRTGYCRMAARSLLSRYSKGAGDIRPPIPVCDIAKFNGYKVVLLETLTDKHSAIVDLHEKLIGVNKKHHSHRRRFSIGHELGHIYLEHPSEDEQSEEEVKYFNLEANEFAGELLVPLHYLKLELKQCKNMDQLANHFNVSPEVVFRRISSQGLLSYI